MNFSLSACSLLSVFLSLCVLHLKYARSKDTSCIWAAVVMSLTCLLFYVYVLAREEAGYQQLNKICLSLFLLCLACPEE